MRKLKKNQRFSSPKNSHAKGWRNPKSANFGAKKREKNKKHQKEKRDREKKEKKKTFLEPQIRN